MIVVMAPRKGANMTPVTKEVKKTMSYARMSSHLLAPLMELSEETHSPFLSSYLNLQFTVAVSSVSHMQEFAWYDVEVTDADNKTIVSSRIGSVNNAKGLYAVVGPIGTHTRHLLMALCGVSDNRNHVKGTFFLNGRVLELPDLMKETSYVHGCDDICDYLTARETLQNAFLLTQPPWV